MPMVMMGFREVMGSWKTVAILPPRILVQSLPFCEQSALKEARELAINSNAVYCGLSGAGPSVIAVYENPNKALNGLEIFKTQGFQSFLVEPTVVGCEETEY